MHTRLVTLNMHDHLHQELCMLPKAMMISVHHAVAIVQDDNAIENIQDNGNSVSECDDSPAL